MVETPPMKSRYLLPVSSNKYYCLPSTSMTGFLNITLAAGLRYFSRISLTSSYEGPEYFGGV